MVDRKLSGLTASPQREGELGRGNGAEPYDTVVLGPDGVGYVWTFRGKSSKE
jgi:hypothetical protein